MCTLVLTNYLHAHILICRASSLFERAFFMSTESLIYFLFRVCFVLCVCMLDEGCDKAAKRGGKCLAHGPRCQVEGCDKGARSGGCCIAHGGGRRCQVEGCDKGAQSGGRSIAHAGRKRKRSHVEGCVQV